MVETIHIKIQNKEFIRRLKVAKEAKQERLKKTISKAMEDWKQEHGEYPKYVDAW